jgi:hypothetical protein
VVSVVTVKRTLLQLKLEKLENVLTSAALRGVTQVVSVITHQG